MPSLVSSWGLLEWHFFSFPFLASSRLILSWFSLVFSCFLSFSFFRFLVFSFLYLLFVSLFLFSNWLASVVRMRSDRYNVQCNVVVSDGNRYSRFFQARVVRRMDQYMDLAHRRLIPDLTFICFWWRHELRQLWSMRVPPLVCSCFFPGVFLSSRVTGAYPVTTDLIAS